MRSSILFVLGLALAVGFGGCADDVPGGGPIPANLPSGKADGVADARGIEVLMTDPHCDVCTGADKDWLQATSPIVPRIIELIDGAAGSVDVAQFTFSRRDIEAALLRAHRRGVKVQLAMNAAMAQGDNVATRLLAAGVAVHFVAGKETASYSGLQHAKFMVVDDRQLLMGSKNWSSTGTTLNEENTVIVHTSATDPMMQAFRCYFDAMVAKIFDNAQLCSTDEVRFTPGTGGWAMIRDAIRGAATSVDVLMHHLLYDDALKTLAQAAERGVRVRVVINAEDRHTVSGKLWERLIAGGTEIRFKRTNAAQFQLMHHKLVVIDDRVVINGSGNWSGSAFFNNYEFYVRFERADVVAPFRALFARLWSWSLSADSLVRNRTAGMQDADERRHYFGNLHAHYHLKDGDKWLDDGEPVRVVEGDFGPEVVNVWGEMRHDPARYAFEYARDRGGLDFMALSPHVQDDDPADADNVANMSRDAFDDLILTAWIVTDESIDLARMGRGRPFVAIPAMEWSTNSSGNHVNVFGSMELAKVRRGEFRTLYESFLPARAAAGDRPLVMYNHPRTFARYDPEDGVDGAGALVGNWDVVYGVNLLEIRSASERRQKFNDFGLDDYEPLASVRESWIAGEVMPDEAVVAATHANIARAAAPYLRLFEVTVARGTELKGETAVNPSINIDPETGAEVRYHKAHSDWDHYLLHGYRAAPAANGDNHAANWGAGHTTRTVVIAGELSEEGLLSAIDERAVYASEDPELKIWFYADERVRQGGELVTTSDRVTLDVKLSDADYAGPFDVSVRVGQVGGGDVRVAASVRVEGDTWTPIPVGLSGVGEHFVYLEVHEPGPNRMAWSAPIWVHRVR